MPIRLLLADDDPLIRESLKIILGLDEEFEIIACVENGLKAVEECTNNSIDVALLDIRMPVLNGVEASKEICKNTKTKVLILTTFDDDEYIMDAIKYGAKGYLLKNNPPDKIREAIKLVFSGTSIIQDEIMEKVKRELASHKSSRLDMRDFTSREIEIIELISEGMSNKEISQKLYISEGTVKNYISTILDKTGLDHRTQIAIFYLKGGKI